MTSHFGKQNGFGQKCRPDVNTERTPEIAKEALVYCVVCMNDTWKIPIAYFY